MADVHLNSSSHNAKTCRHTSHLKAALKIRSASFMAIFSNLDFVLYLKKGRYISFCYGEEDSVIQRLGKCSFSRQNINNKSSINAVQL